MLGVCVTDAGLNVDIVTPLSVPQTPDPGLVVACAREAPALSSAVIFDCRGIGSGVDTLNTRPVGHQQIVLK